MSMNDRPLNWYRQRRFAILLVILVILLIGPPVLFGFGQSGVLLDAVTSLVLLAVITSMCFEPRQRVFAVILGIPSILFTWGAHAFSGHIRSSVLLAGAACEVLFLFGAAVLIVRTLLTTRPLTTDSLFAAICGYLFLGLGWSVIFTVTEDIQPGSLDVSQRLANQDGSTRPLPYVLTYFSFTTLTTVGYGDVSPVSPTARTCAWVEAIMGQFYLAVVVAGLVSVLAQGSGPETHD